MRKKTFTQIRGHQALSAGVMSLLLLGCLSEGLSIGNLSSSDDTISFKIANDSATAGDVVFWVEQNGMIFCERITDLRPHFSYTISFRCPSLRAGQFMLRYSWAAQSRERALVAMRIN